MKNVFKVFAILAIIGFLAACNNGDDPLPAHIHQWGDWTTTTPATCTTAGMQTRVCTLDATHTETQSIAIDPNAHQWGAWTLTTLATATSEGVETRTCVHNSAHKETRKIPQLQVTSTTDFENLLNGLEPNTITTPYTIILNIMYNNREIDLPKIKNILLNATDKFISLDLSGSTITGFLLANFQYCTSLTSIILPDSITGALAPLTFYGCTNLTSVTFQSIFIIPYANSFPGDLQAKYSMEDGGIGMYTRETDGTEWTKQ